jgi:polyhydroxybutyrate depolymerase
MMASQHKYTRVVRLLALGLLPSSLAACGASDADGAGQNGNVDTGSAAGAPAMAPGGQGPAMTPPEASNPASTPNGETNVVPSGPASNEGTGAAQPGGLNGGGNAPPDDGSAEPGPGAGNMSEPCAASTELQPGDTTRQLAIDGVQRSFLVHVPPGYDGTTRVPVVFDFHGLGGNSNQQKNLSRWDDVADANGFISVYPQGIDNAWNAGLCCGDGGDDVPFVRAIISDLASNACIDNRRVFSSGCSNGGGMSYKLACEAADVIAAVAPVDFDCVDGAGCSNCNPGRPITVVQFRGTNDQLVAYEGSGAFAGARANLATWGEINECTGAPSELAQNDSCESFPTCGDGAQTVLCTVQGGTHCGSYGSFSIAEVAWGVLQNQALP